jgi:hypothetical protein
MRSQRLIRSSSTRNLPVATFVAAAIVVAACLSNGCGAGGAEVTGSVCMPGSANCPTVGASDGGPG